MRESVCVCGRRAAAGSVLCLSHIHRLRFKDTLQDKELHSAEPAWVRRRRQPMACPLCTLDRGWWGQKWTCFHRDILTKTETEGEQRPGSAVSFSLSPSASTSVPLSILFSSCFFFFFFFFFIFPIFCLYSPAVSDTEMFAELLCGAVALVLYVNTLGADFCYDDRYLGEWVTSSSGLSSQQHSSDAWLQSLCRSNSEWAASNSTGHIGVYSCELQLYH